MNLLLGSNKLQDLGMGSHSAPHHTHLLSRQTGSNTMIYINHRNTESYHPNNLCTILHFSMCDSWDYMLDIILHQNSILFHILNIHFVYFQCKIGNFVGMIDKSSSFNQSRSPLHNQSIDFNLYQSYRSIHMSNLGHYRYLFL